MAPLSDAALGRLIADCDHLISPDPLTVRAAALELRELRAELTRTRTALHNLTAYVEDAASNLKQAVQEAINAA
jgi:SMC interacting uncharacterized protein involved in chromosome segregation